MLGDNCSSACPTKDHWTFGECVRAKNVHDMWLGGTGPSLGDQKRFDKTNEDFRTAVADGLSPAAVSDNAIRQAYAQAEKG